MTCEACQEAFRHEPYTERAAKVHAATNECCGCEKYKAWEHSPGRILDNEILHLLITDPTNLLNGVELDPTLAMQIDRGGLSTLREGASNNEFLLTIQALRARSAEKGDQRFFHGVLTFEAGTVRKIDGGRFLCIYDTGMADKPHHADLMAPPVSGASKSERKRAEMARYKSLIEAIGPSFVPAARFRGGVFSGYTRR